MKPRTPPLIRGGQGRTASDLLRSLFLRVRRTRARARPARQSFTRKTGGGNHVN